MRVGTEKAWQQARPRRAGASFVFSMELPKGLKFTCDEHPGCTRRRRGRGFAYYDPAGVHIKDRAEIERFNALAVPPAYRRVWLCADPRGHLQSTGRDARGRKQYRYHPDYRAFRELRKFDRLSDFGHALGGIRRAVNRELARAEPGDKRYATALVVKLLDRTGFRIGNESYLRRNRTRGLLTLSDKNVESAAAKMEFDFKTKGGKRISRSLTNKRLAACVNRLQELPGQRIFVYRNDSGGFSDLTSEDVNAFLSDVAEEGFTAKDFRTWIGTREAAAAMGRAEVENLGDPKALQAAWKEATQAAAKTLANTVAVARNSYIHPEINSEKALRFFREKMVDKPLQAMPNLTRVETALIEFLG